MIFDYHIQKLIFCGLYTFLIVLGSLLPERQKKPLISAKTVVLKLKVH